jgi:hypothetical protein
MTVTIDELRRKARYAGFLYLLMGLIRRPACTGGSVK